MKKETFELNKHSVGFVFNDVRIVEVTTLILCYDNDTEEQKFKVVKECYINNKFYHMLSNVEFNTLKFAQRSFDSMVHDSEFDKSISEM